MSSLCRHTLSQSLSPLANTDSQVNDSLLQIIPHFNEALLQLVDVTYMAFVYTLLHDSPDQIWTSDLDCLGSRSAMHKLSEM